MRPKRFLLAVFAAALPLLAAAQAYPSWPAGDFRTAPKDSAATHVLIAVVVAAATAHAIG